MGLWHLDENNGAMVRDASGNNNDGTIFGGAVWTIPGRFGYCLDFDGVDDYLDIPDAPSLDIDSATGELTMEAWINPAASGGMHWRKIIAKRYAGTGSEATNYEMCLDQTTGNLTFYNGRMAQIYVSSVHPPLGQWSYVAISLSAVEGVLRFYLNGQELDQIPGAVFVVDIKKEEIAIREAKKLRVPIFAIVDTNCDPTQVDFPIPGNDDSTKSVTVIARVIADAILEGREAIQAKALEAEELPVKKEEVKN